jgi:hypothetical protein
MMLLVIYSLYFGISPHDESYYVAMPYRMVLGDHFFINEYSLGQTASFFTYPFIKLFIYITKSTDSIILFARYLHLIANLILATLVFYSFKKISATWIALLLALICIVFTPFNIHSLSYNTLAILFATAGYFLIFIAALPHNNKQQFSLIFLAGICHAWLSISYPTLLLIPIIVAICASYYFPKLKFLTYYGLGLFVGGIGFIFLLLHIGTSQLLIDINYAKSIGVQGGGWHKISTLAQSYWLNFPNKGLILGLLFIAFVFKNKLGPWLSLFPLVILGILLFHTLHMWSYGGSIFLLIHLSFLAPFFLLITVSKHDSSIFKQLLILIWLPAFIAGLITSWSSSNGECNNIIGSFPAALISIFYILGLNNKIQINSHKNIGSINLSIIGLLVGLTFIIILQYFNLHYIYDDSDLSQLNCKLNSGPFKSIYTTTKACNYYTQLHQDLKTISSPNKTILFFDAFPAGYLFSNMRPSTNTIWLFSSAIYPSIDRKTTIKYFIKNKTWPAIIFRMKHVPSDFPDNFYVENNQDPLILLTQKYHLILQRDGYDVYQRR